MTGKNPNQEPNLAEADEWFSKAKQDIRVTKLCLEESEDLSGMAAYRCQQAAEKSLKGLLIAVGVSFRRTHELDELATLVCPFFPNLVDRINLFRPLSHWCWAYRYPGLDHFDIRPPSKVEIETIIKNIESILIEIPSYFEK
jgi:HEPN domain-containing protein